MGSYQECEDNFILSANKIVVDHVEQCLHRGALKNLSKRGLLDKDNIYTTIGEPAAGQKIMPRVGNERILCVPVGTGMLDIAVATVVMRNALDKGLGSRYAFV